MIDCELNGSFIVSQQSTPAVLSLVGWFFNILGEIMKLSKFMKVATNYEIVGVVKWSAQPISNELVIYYRRIMNNSKSKQFNPNWTAI